MQVLNDLLQWYCFRHFNDYIIGIHEIRVAALVHSAVEGMVCLRRDRVTFCRDMVDLSKISWSDPVHFLRGRHTSLPTDLSGDLDYNPGSVTLVDLAVLFGHTELAALLAKHGVPLSIDVVGVRRFLELNDDGDCPQYIHLKMAMAAAIVAGGFMEQASLAANWLGDKLTCRAIFFGTAEVATELKECGAKVPSAGNFLKRMCERNLLSDRRIWHAAACAGVDLKSGFRAELRFAGPPGITVGGNMMALSMSLLDVMLLGGFSGAAFELLKANACMTMAGTDAFLQASLFSLMTMNSGLVDEVDLPIAPFCGETISHVLQLVIPMAGQQYGVPLLQILGRLSMVEHVLGYLVIFPSELRGHLEFFSGPS